MLKKIILAAVVAATASFAQINLGVRAGLDMNTFWGDDTEDFDPSDNVTLTEWALDIPVLVRFSLLPILYLEAGPEFAFNLSVSAENDDGDEIKFDDDYFNTFEFDLVFGVGTGIVPLVDIDFRVVLGMTNFFADPEIGDPLDVSNMQFVLGATYWF